MEDQIQLSQEQNNEIQYNRVINFINDNNNMKHITCLIHMIVLNFFVDSENSKVPLRNLKALYSFERDDHSEILKIHVERICKSSSESTNYHDRKISNIKLTLDKDAHKDSVFIKLILLGLICSNVLIVRNEDRSKVKNLLEIKSSFENTIFKLLRNGDKLTSVIRKSF